jgi:hypothetical protein
MRHSSYSTTADTYTHVTPAHSAEAVQTVAALFEGRPGSSFPTPRARQASVRQMVE